MKRMKRGFTIVEVSLFLAVTALLFVGVTIGTQNSVNQQRYTESVNSFADFLRNIYSEVSNPESNGQGNSNLAIYGRLVSIGESIDNNGGANSNTIYVYDLLGDADAQVPGNSAQESLKNVNATVAGVLEKTTEGVLTTTTYGTYGMIEDFTPHWESTIEEVGSNDKLKATILIVRHPRSGTITTLVWKDNMGINERIKDISGATVEGGGVSENAHIAASLKNLNEYLSNSWSKFSSSEIDFCVNPFGDSSRRQNIRLAAGARNSSAVQVIELDGDDNRCENGS